MKMQLLSSGAIRMSRRLFYPEADREERADYPVFAILLRHPQGNVLFDSGCHPEAAERWGPLTKALTPLMRPGEDILSALGAVGLGPDDIDLVVNSHLHCDHCGCNAFFEKASFLIHARELERVRDPAVEGQGYFRADWDVPMPIEAVDGERDLFGDGHIVLLPLPGHTPGSIGALVQLERSGRFLLAVDAVAIREHLENDFVPKNAWNAEQARASMAEVRRIAQGGATVVCGHDGEQWAGLKKGPETYD